jgi:hypothetical protein
MHTILAFRNIVLVDGPPREVRQHTGSTLFVSSFNIDLSGIDVPIDFHVAGWCANIEHPLLTFASGKCKSSKPHKKS